MVLWMAMIATAPAGPSISDTMHERYRLLTEARDAVVRGDLAYAQGWAGQLIEMEGHDAPRKWRGWLAQLNASAAAVELAPDLSSAATGIGQTAAACGNCHVAEKGGPELGNLGAIPTQEWDEGQNMSLHRWAMHWMWLGLIKGDTDTWKRGAAALDNRPLAFRFGEGAPDDLRALEQRVYEIAAHSLTANRSQRGPLMGQLVATCSECHTRLNTGPAAPDTTPIVGEDLPATIDTDDPPPAEETE